MTVIGGDVEGGNLREFFRRMKAEGHDRGAIARMRRRGYLTYVGWLEPPHLFPIFPDGETIEPLLDALFEMCDRSTNKMSGDYSCLYCAESGLPPARGNRVERHGMQLRLGSAEIRVSTEAGEIFTAPDLIYHYVSEHHYQPPLPFVIAVMTRYDTAVKNW
jgi:hypothetical protein